MILLETVGLTKKFDDFTVINNVNFKMSEMEIRTLIGPNGAGKSTFFDLITKRITPTKGKILFEGKNITKLHSYRIARAITRKFQTPNVYEDMTVFDNIWVSAQSKLITSPVRNLFSRKDAALDAVWQILGLVQLSDRENALAGELSHGEKQWLEIGMSIANKPKLLLLDEPTAGMTDAETSNTVRLIRSIAEKFKLAVLVIEHDLKFVRELNPYITVLSKGQILAEGTLDEIQSNAEVSKVYLGVR